MNPGCRRSRMILATVGIGVVVSGGCSGKNGQPSAGPTSIPATMSTTVMINGEKHTIIGGVACTSAAAQPNATPAESGDLTTRISVHDDSASVALALSDETPPGVDGFAVSLKVESGEYRLSYQAPESATQVQAAKKGMSYTVTGTGQGGSPKQGDVHQLTFGIHVTCP
jgi:hypothetical protein